MGLTFENPPSHESMRLLNREEISAALVAARGKWAVVSRPDRVDRAQKTADRITAGTEYGPGFEATVRSAGDRADVRVYARFTGKAGN